MDYNFDYSFIKKKTPIVTLSSYGIAFNSGAIDHLGDPDEVIIGYDEEKHAIGIRERGNDVENPFFNLKGKDSHGWKRIGAKDFVRFLSKETGIDFLTRAKQFIPTFDRESKTLIVVIDEFHQK